MNSEQKKPDHQGNTPDRYQTEEALKRRVNELSALNTMTVGIMSARNVDELFNYTLDEVLQLVGVETSGVLLLDEKKSILRLVAHRGLSDEFVQNFRELRLGEGLAGKVAQTGKPAILRDLAEYPKHRRGFLAGNNIQSAVSVPLIGTAGIIGVMNLGASSPEYFDPAGLAMLENLGRQIAIGVEKLRLAEALQAAEKKFRALVEHGADCILALEESGKITYASPGLTRILGYEPDEFVGQIGFEYVHPKDENRIRDIFRRVLQESGRVETVECRARHRSGQWRWIDATITNLMDEPDVGSIVLNFHNVTERKRIEEEIRTEKELLRTILNNIPVMITMYDSQGRMLLLNREFERFIGWSLEEAEKVDLMKEIYPDPEYRKIVWEHMMSARPGWREFKVTKRNGEIVESAWSNVRLSDGTQIGIGVDILRLIAAEKALLESKQRFDLLLNRLNDVVWIASADGSRILEVNHAFEKVYGISGDELRFNPHLWLERVHPDDREIAEASAEQLRTNGQADVEYRIVRPDGEVRWIRDRKSLVYDKEGRPLQVGGIAHEITERKRADQLLRRFNLASLALARLHTPEEIYTAITQELKKLGFSSAIFLTDESRSRLIPRYISLDERVIQAVEKLTGLKAKEFSISIEDIPLYKRVISEGKPCFKENSEDILRQVLPGPAKRFAAQIIKTLKIPKAILVPLVVEDEVIGLLSVQSHDLREEDVPAIAAFAHQLSAALEKAQRYAASQQRLRELETLYTLSSKLRQVEDIESMLPSLLGEARSILGADSGAVILLEPDGEHFRVALADGFLSALTGRIFSINEGISGHVLRTRQPYASLDYATDPHHLEDMPAGEYTGPSMYVPLESETALLGVLALSRFGDPKAQPFTPAELRLLAAIGEMAGNALRRMWLFDDAQRRLKRVQALRNIDLAITSSLDPRVTLRVLLDEVTTNLKLDAAAVLLVNPYTQTLEYAAGHGFHNRAIERTHLRLGEDYAGRAALERRVVGIPDLSQVDDFARQQMILGEDFKAYYAAPMISKGRVLGVLETFYCKPSHSDGEWIDFLEALAGQAAIAIENAQLFLDLEQSNTDLLLAYDATIEGWSRAMDLRDRETEGHTQRVTELTLKLARKLGISDKQLVYVRRGALLHDMGKLGVPDSILLKAGKLTDEEWEIMRCHPQFAYEMLSPVEYLRPALEIPYCHHERWDGAGYPRGLKGEQIPLEARIFAVVDVWDALMSDRPYRDAWPREKALAYIRQEAGSHFDPQVVEMFFALMDDDESAG